MLQKLFSRAAVLAIAAAAAAGCGGSSGPAEPVAHIVSASGDLTAALAEFRGAAGEPLNTTPGQTSGRREINWDAVGAAFTNTDTFPGDFFNSTDPAVGAARKRGAVFTTPGTGLRVSDKDFSDVSAAFGNDFDAFSPARTFAAVGSNIVDVTFRLPGTTTVATTNGFAAIFSDVDRLGSTTIEFFDAKDKSLGRLNVPARTDVPGFSLAGAIFDSPKVARVRITAGSAALAGSAADLTDNGAADLVVMDDFLYGEPQAL